MSENKHNGRPIGGKGYYIALILCALVIGVTGYVYSLNSEDGEVLLQEAEVISVGTMAPVQEDIPVLATDPPGETTLPAPAQTQPTRPPVQRKLKTQSPVSGQEIHGYAMEALSYNDTTRDWRVHNGVDLAAEEGEPVCAAADGTVYTTYEDDSMGHTVVIRHEGGYTTRYSSLTSDVMVASGDTVEAGQTIGYAGATALVETTLGSHVHFSVTHQDIPMDPAEFLALGQ